RTPEEPSTTSTVPVTVIEVIERAGWGAVAAGDGMEEHVVERLTIHHTGVALEDNRDAPARLRAHQVFHQTDRGWPDLAYHFAIDQAGNIYEGRSPEFRGDTATSYDPTGHLLVVLEGNFDVEPTIEAQLGSLRHLLAWAAGHHSVDVDSIKSHRDYAPGETSCPGANLYALLESGELVREVELLLAEAVIELIYLRGEVAVERVAEIEAP
ncbi:MAG TPA: peptidoglycan recognition family protein, partial [Acidimicrobiia bacterium]|nr:peptidoglycan recognition family protein [Acidimicrobiia bacterium]